MRKSISFFYFGRKVARWHCSQVMFASAGVILIGPDWKKAVCACGIAKNRRPAESVSVGGCRRRQVRAPRHSHSVLRRKRTHTSANCHDRIRQNHWTDAAARQRDPRLSRLQTQRYVKFVVIRQVSTRYFFAIFTLPLCNLAHMRLCLRENHIRRIRNFSSPRVSNNRAHIFWMLKYSFWRLDVIWQLSVMQHTCKPSKVP